MFPFWQDSAARLRGGGDTTNVEEETLGACGVREMRERRCEVGEEEEDLKREREMLSPFMCILEERKKSFFPSIFCLSFPPSLWIYGSTVTIF